MCHAYKKQRWVKCLLLNMSPNLIDRKKTVQVEKAPPHPIGIQVKKVLTEFMHTKILKCGFYGI